MLHYSPNDIESYYEPKYKMKVKVIKYFFSSNICHPKSWSWNKMRSEVHFFWYIVLLALFQRRKSIVQGFTISLLENHFGEAKFGLILRKSPLHKVKVDSKSTLRRVRKIQSPNIELLFLLNTGSTHLYMNSFISF